MQDREIAVCLVPPGLRIGTTGQRAEGLELVLILLPPHGLWYADYKSVRDELDARGAVGVTGVGSAAIGPFGSAIG